MFISIMRLGRGVSTASMALLLTAAACGAGDAAPTGPDSTPTPGTSTPPPSGSTVPSQFVGEWLHGFVSMSGYVDAYNGQWLDNAYGTSVMFEFAANGSYKQSILIKTSVYSCRMQVYIYNEGKAVFDASTIKTYPTKGTIKSLDTCNAQNNYTRPDDIARKQGQSYGWHFGKNADNPSDPQTYLILGVGETQSPAYFRRAQ